MLCLHDKIWTTLYACYNSFIGHDNYEIMTFKSYISYIMFDKNNPYELVSHIDFFISTIQNGKPPSSWYLIFKTLVLGKTIGIKIFTGVNDKCWTKVLQSKFRATDEAVLGVWTWSQKKTIMNVASYWIVGLILQHNGLLEIFH